MLETVSIHFRDQKWAAISVNISDANDVYVNYLGDDQKRHTSYHSSGQKHLKVGKRYVQWTEGPSGCWEPMKESKDKPAAVHGREKVAVWGWPITNIPDVLPALVAASEMIVDVEAVPQPRILGLEVSIIGSCAGVRLEIVGYPVVQRHRISNGVVTVEIEAFLVEDVDKPAQSDSDPHLDISG